MRRIVIRIDAGGPWGLGHAMRMLALAPTLEAYDPDNIRVTFATATPEILRPLCQAGQYDLLPLAPAFRVDAQLRMCLTAAPDILMVDHPGLVDPETWTYCRQHTRVVRVDHPWAEAETCDLLVLPHMHLDPETLATLEAAFNDRLLYGADYVLLNPVLHQARVRPPGLVHHTVLFTAGGSDPTGFLAQVYDMTRDLTRSFPTPLRLYGCGLLATPPCITSFDPLGAVVGYDPAMHLRGVQLVCCPFGVTVYEALYMGTPVVTIGRTPADMQAAQQLQLATEGAVLALPGTLDQLDRTVLLTTLTTLLNDPARLRTMHHASAGRIDGQGAPRVAEAMLHLERR